MHVSLICADQDSWASGMRSISAALREAGHGTTKVLAGGTSATLTNAEVAALASLVRDSEIVGVSSMSRGSARAKAILAAVRPLGKVTVWGGVHASLFPQDCTPHADLVCRGEGEKFMTDLVGRVAAGTPIVDIPNGAYEVGGRATVNDVRPLVTNLDSLPFPDYSPDNEFVLNGGSPSRHDEFRNAQSPMFSGSRGCVYSCSYCSNADLRALYRGQRHYARKMSVRRFVEVAEEHRRVFPGAVSFYFTDEDFFARPEREVEEFAELYPKRVGLPFECMASPLHVTETKMALMAKAGMWRIDVGVESGSERTRTGLMGRPVSDGAAVQAALAVSRHPEVVAYYFLIIGNPYETRQDLIQTIEFLRRLPGPFFLRTYNLVFLPGTQLFNSACQDGIISGIEDSAYGMDFLAGYDWRGPDWKRRNLYLNSLLSLMTGKHNHRRMGFAPKALTPILTSARMVDFCERHAGIGKTLVVLAKVGLGARRRGLEVVSRLVKDRRLAYGLRASLIRGDKQHKSRRTEFDGP